MAKILVIDDEALVRELIACSLRAHGHEVNCAGDARTALGLIRAGMPDLALLDVRLPEVDGLSLLRAIRDDPAIAGLRVILLTSSTDKSIILQAAKLSIEGYMLKSGFSLSELLARIQRLASGATEDKSQTPSVSAVEAHTNAGAEVIGRSAPQPAPERRESVATPAAARPNKASSAPPGRATWPVILTREQTLERLETVAGGKTLAGVVMQLISVVNSPRADMSDVVRVIQSDPILSSRVLQLANSASAGSRGRVRSVDEAARNMGVRGIHSMAISIGIMGAFPPDENDGFNSMRCWQHSYAVAEVLNLLPRRQNAESEGVNHLVGLCHDLGEILLRQHFATEYAQVLDFALGHGLDLHDVESTALGIRHAELISRLLARIGLPATVVQAVREFHERQSHAKAGGISAATQGLLLANFAAHGLLLAASTHEVVRPITRTEWKLLSTEKPPPAIDPAGLRGEILTTMALLASLPATEQLRLQSPLVPRSEARIWYVRPEGFIEFDPLGFALTLSADTVIAPTLPEPHEWRDIDAVVLVGIRPGVQMIVPADLAAAAEKAGRPGLPMLALVAQATDPVEQRGVLLRSYPISLGDLADWLGKLSPALQPLAASVK